MLIPATTLSLALLFNAVVHRANSHLEVLRVVEIAESSLPLFMTSVVDVATYP